jgi:transposase
MRPNKEKVYNYLFACQQRFGGYTGIDIDKVARTRGFNRKTVKRNVEKWSKTDPRFAELKYIGQRSIPVTLEEIAILNQRLKESITCTKQDLIREINET